jgi:endonuclease III related protein
MAVSSRLLLSVYDRLFAAYGPQDWWPGEGAFETIVGAILTQSAAWPNVEQAIDRLKAAGVLDPASMLQISEEELAALVRPSGYYNAKARKLRAFCEMLQRDFGGSLDALLGLPAKDLRERLLATHGIGPETADDIVLYAAEKPSFVIDAYTRRIFSRLGIAPEGDAYEDWRTLFMSRLPSSVSLFNEYHALIVRHAKVACAKRPRCARCVLRDSCREAACEELDVRDGE